MLNVHQIKEFTNLFNMHINNFLQTTIAERTILKLHADTAHCIHATDELYIPHCIHATDELYIPHCIYATDELPYIA